MRFSLLIASFFVAVTSFAGERAVVQQMKGRRAIIQFEKDIPFSVGQAVYINSETGVELGVRNDARNFLQRQNVVELSGGFSTTDTDPETTIFTVSGRYGFNYGNYEFGGRASFKSTEAGSSERSEYTLGGFFDYNLVPNKPGEDFVYGAYAELGIGNQKVGSQNFSYTEIIGGGFLKWFVFSPVLAVRLNLFYQHAKPENGDASNTTGISWGLAHYF
jgi:hypothetical protein